MVLQLSRFPRGRSDPTEHGPADTPGEIVEALGTIEAEQVSVAPEIGGWILQLSMDEGSEVLANQEVAWLD